MRGPGTGTAARAHQAEERAWGLRGGGERGPAKGSHWDSARSGPGRPGALSNGGSRAAASSRGAGRPLGTVRRASVPGVQTNTRERDSEHKKVIKVANLTISFLFLQLFGGYQFFTSSSTRNWFFFFYIL